VNGEHLVNTFANTFANTFLREVNTLNTLRVFNSLVNKNTNYSKYICTESVHCVHQQKQSVRKTMHEVFANWEAF